MADKYGKAYARIIAEMSGVEYRGREMRGQAARILKGKLEAYARSAEIVLRVDDYNEVAEGQEERLVKAHRKAFREAIERDEKEKAEWA
ncbi:hypothetical protein ACFY5K_25635 [Streptomyces griseofuscus]|uniref:hypothetical protein n=1 Tax=Streptomyces griseofuscus TaxID=146922 RepID=UPI00369F35C1